MADALSGQSLFAIYSVFEKMKSKTAPKPAPAASSSGPKEPSPQETAEAEALKGKGNAAMKDKAYQLAIDFYTQALKIIPNNPIYLSNRAAAYSNIGEYDSAITDAQVAVDTDPTYSKAWSRLGHARYSKGDSRGAMEAYKAGIDSEGNGGTQLMRVGYETAKKKVDQEEAVSSNRGTDSPSGGSPGSPGGFDFASILNNPAFANNPLMNAAKEKLSDPGELNRMMNDPMMKSIFGGGEGGMPDMSKIAGLMQNPQFAAMAQNLLGSLGGGGGGFGGPSGPSGEH